MNPLLIRGEDGTIDPVYVDEFSGRWYFFEETWAHYQGPFATEDDARRMLQLYCDTVLCSRPD